MLQIEHHDSHESSWFVHNGRVYDATAFLKDHPGGAESILIVAGQDATDEFNAIHSAKAKAMLNDYLIGKVAPAGSIAPAAQAPSQEVGCLSIFPALSLSHYFFLLNVCVTDISSILAKQFHQHACCMLFAAGIVRQVCDWCGGPALHSCCLGLAYSAVSSGVH